MGRQLTLHTSSTDWTVHGQPHRPLRIALVNMPWARCDLPSIQCGLLKAELARFGHQVDIHHLNLDLSAHLGPTAYQGLLRLSADRQNLLGEWLFTVAAFGPPAALPDSTEYFASYGDPTTYLAEDGFTTEDLVRLRDEVLPRWITGRAEAVRWERYDLVGFTSTFSQNVPAIALAQQIKQRHPEVPTVFGGANFDGEMGPEFVRCFTAIDYAVSGEGDLVLPALAARLSAGESPVGLPGVWSRDADGTVVGAGQAPRVEKLDHLPEPDYGDYFADLERLGQDAALGERRPALVFETSRGCWWGEKHHCTFCGLNAMGMAYRSKSPDRVLDELATLTDRHRVLNLFAVDNILDMRYLGTLCQRLADERWDPQIFYEVKANLSRDQLRTLKRAGITRIQPGIESLSAHVLSLMRKGATMLTNLRLLKWSRYYDIRVLWNVLYGFPGERDSDYEEQIDLVPWLTHLMPPSGCGELWLERFAPYFTDDFPIHDVRPAAAYRYIYPVDGIDLGKVAYYFDYRAAQVCSEDVRARLEKVIDAWKDRWADGRPPVLTYQRGRDWMTILDTRGDSPRRLSLSGWRAAAYEGCDDRPRGVRPLRESLAPTAPDLTDEQVAEFLDACVGERLMVRENGRYLSLALPRNGNW